MARKPHSVPPGESWDSYRKSVTDSLERLEAESREQLKELSEMRSAVAVLQAKVSLYGAGAGALAAAVVSVLAQLIGWRLH